MRNGSMAEFNFDIAVTVFSLTCSIVKCTKMKAVEFHTRLHAPDTIEIPELYQGQIDAEQDIRVIVLIDDKKDNDASWQDVVTKQYFAGYTDLDTEYDKL